jgi:hypothetical protein
MLKSDYHVKVTAIPPFLSYPILSYPILSYPILSYPILSYPILSFPILSYPILSYPILSYPILSYPILSYPVLSSPVLSNPMPSSPLPLSPSRSYHDIQDLHHVSASPPLPLLQRVVVPHQPDPHKKSTHTSRYPERPNDGSE